MGTFKSIFTPISLRLLLFFLMAVIVNSTTLQDDIVCALIDCGEGTCKASNASLLGFDCECNSGWNKIEIGSLTFPSCVIPNCTIDFGCGDGAPPPPPPPASLPPPFDPSNPCNLVWCGEGTCVANGTGHICQCNAGSSNLFNMTGFACFKQCYFGADCNGLVFGKSPPPPSTLMPPPTSSSASPRANAGPTGSTEASNSLRHLCASSMIILAATFLAWV